MANHIRVLLPLALTLATVLGNEAVSGYPVSLPDCPDSCGNVSIPYPFGTREGCYLDETFLVTCNHTIYNPPKAFLRESNILITDIMLITGELRYLGYVAHQCFDSNGIRSPEESNLNPWIRFANFTLSSSKNKFTVVGCDVTASFKGYKYAKSSAGCSTTCETLDAVTNGSCTGIGCCQLSIPRRAKGTWITMSSFHNHKSVWSFDRCSYAFLVEESAYNFSSLDFKRLNQVERLPVIVDWTVADQTCEEAKQNPTSYACKENRNCYEADNGSGYRCNCSEGYEGNPYLPNGCLAISISISTILLAGAWLYWGLQKRKLIQLRKKHFQENGGSTLQHLLSQHEREIDTFKIFTAEELNKATHNYDDRRVLGKGGQGTVYEGVLPGMTIVAVKKSNAIDKTQVQQFVNEVIVLSQINHRNVVKLIGCCLETEVPMLVYEFITNGTLFDHIQKDYTPQMPWHTRLRIAAEIAGALSYLHSSASIPIIHRDIKTTNILLDNSYTAKVSDFGTSKFAPVDKTSMTTLVQGTLGYLDPEYFYSSQLTEKSDVYSFGVVLVELLTGEKALNFERKEEERSLAMYFVLSLKGDRLFELVDESIKRQANARQISEVAMIAAKCLSLRGEDRPTMKEVAVELEGLSKREMHPWVQADMNADQESEVLIHGSIRSQNNSLQAANLAIGR